MSDLIADCIESILVHTKAIGYEVIIVDNNSEPDIREKLTSNNPLIESSNYHFIILQENIGFGRANNEGIKIARGRNILFLNPDTILLNNAIKILSDFLDGTKDAGGCGGNLLDNDLNPSYSFYRYLPGIFWEFNELLNNLPKKAIYGKNSHYNRTGKPFKVGYISGADLMVKKTVLDLTGGFRKEYFLYYEESDLCKRIKDAGYRIYSVPAAEIKHLESKSMPSNGEWESGFKTENIEKSRNFYYDLNTGGITSFISNLFYRLNLYSRYILLPNGNKKEYYKKRISLYKALPKT